MQPFGDGGECNQAFMEEKVAQLRRALASLKADAPAANEISPVDGDPSVDGFKGVRLRRTRMGTVLEVHHESAFMQGKVDAQNMIRTAAKFFSPTVDPTRLTLRIQTALLMTTEAECSNGLGLKIPVPDTTSPDGLTTLPPLCDATCMRTICEWLAANHQQPSDGEGGKWGDSEYAFAQVVMGETMNAIGDLLANSGGSVQQKIVAGNEWYSLKPASRTKQLKSKSLRGSYGLEEDEDAQDYKHAFSALNFRAFSGAISAVESTQWANSKVEMALKTLQCAGGVLLGAATGGVTAGHMFASCASLLSSIVRGVRELFTGVKDQPEINLDAILVELGYAKEYADELEYVLEDVKERNCEGFRWPAITEKAAETLVCATHVVHQYTSSRTIDGEAVDLTDINGGQVDITQAAAELRNYREMVVHALQLLQIEISLHCEGPVAQKVDLMSLDLGLIPEIQQRRNVDKRLWEAVQKKDGWTPDEIGAVINEPHIPRRARIDVLQMSEQDIQLFQQLYDGRPGGGNELTLAHIKAVKDHVDTGDLSAQGESVAKAFIWERETLDTTLQPLPDQKNDVTAEICEKLEKGWKEHSDYSSAAAKVEARPKLEWCRSDASTAVTEPEQTDPSTAVTGDQTTTTVDVDNP